MAMVMVVVILVIGFVVAFLLIVVEVGGLMVEAVTSHVGLC
jgi:hypothetical protein